MRPFTAAVVIPVHGQLDRLAACLASLAAVRPLTPYDLILVDDATPGGLGKLPAMAAAATGAPTATSATSATSAPTATSAANAVIGGSSDSGNSGAKSPGSADSATSPGSAHGFGRRQVTVLTRTRQGGFTAAVNTGLRAAVAAGYDATVLLNSDMEVLPGWLDALVARLHAEAGAGLVGGMELAPSDPDRILCGGNRPVFAHGELTSLLRLDRSGSLRAGDWQAAERLEWVSFGVVLIDRRAHAALGDLDERFANYFSDADYGMRANLAGFSVWYEPACRVLHHRHQTTRVDGGGEAFLRLQVERERFCGKWLPGGLLLGRDVRRWAHQGMHARLPWLPRLIPHLSVPAPLGHELRARLITDEAVRRDVTLAAVGGEGLAGASEGSLARATGERGGAARNTPIDPGRLEAFRRLYARRLAFADFLPPSAAGCQVPDPWGGQPVLVLAPHCDDAALSLGGMLLAGAGRAASTHVQVLFGRSSHAIGPLAGLGTETVSRLRGLEEAAFCAHAGAGWSIMPLPDRLLRHPGRPILLRGPDEVESGTTAELVAILRRSLDAYRQQGQEPLVLAPLAAGLMADHAAVAVAAATLVTTGELAAGRLLIYDDLPYAAAPGAVRDGIELYRRCGIHLLPWAIDVSPWFAQKCELLGLYASQLDDETLGVVERYGQSPLHRLAASPDAAAPSAAGQQPGTAIGDRDPGATASGHQPGAASTGYQPGATARGQSPGAAASGQSQGAAASGQSQGAAASGQSQGAAASGQSPGATASGQSQGAAASGRFERLWSIAS